MLLKTSFLYQRKIWYGMVFSLLCWINKPSGPSRLLQDIVHTSLYGIQKSPEHSHHLPFRFTDHPTQENHIPATSLLPLYAHSIFASIFFSEFLFPTLSTYLTLISLSPRSLLVSAVRPNFPLLCVQIEPCLLSVCVYILCDIWRHY